MPIDQRLLEEIAAAVAAHNATSRRPPLVAADAIRLLTGMFADADVCRRNHESLMAEGFSRGILVRLLQLLIDAGFVSKERGAGRDPNTYRLRRQP